jgi:hypothetical protein
VFHYQCSDLANGTIAIQHGVFWVDKSQKKVFIFDSGRQRISMSAISMVGRATVTVLRNPERYQNRPAYFADITISNNELLDLVTNLDPQGVWESNEVTLDSFLEQAKIMWDKDSANGVQDRLSTTAYKMLGTYGIFEKSNRYGADMSDHLEPGCGISIDTFKESLQKAITD